jgi:diguanylate cyclase (GGDEF)-like protein
MIDPASIQRPSDRSELAPLQSALGAAWPRLAALLLEHCARTQAPLAVKDVASGHYVWANAPMAALAGRPLEEVIGRGDAEIFPALPAAALRAAEQAALAQPQGSLVEHRLEAAGGAREVSVLRLALAGEDGRAGHVAALWSDVGAARSREARLAAALAQIEEQQRAHEALRGELADPARHDVASGLHRGGLFDELMRREVDLSSREHREFALVLVQLDAPATGGERDAALEALVVDAVARQLRGKTRAMDASCRLGERRFAVLLSGVGLATAHARMESLRRQCAQEIVVHEGRDLGYSVSMGVASFPHTADAQPALVEAAEEALAGALRRGGNQVALASIRFDAD